MKKILGLLVLFSLVALLAGNVYAAPIVTYTISGSSGDWTLDFSVTNNLGDNNNIYFFGVQLPARDITASPSGWDPDAWPSFNPSDYISGGPNIDYNNNWYTPVEGVPVIRIFNGQTLSGFTVHDTSLTAPTSVPWFAFAGDGTYSGTDYFGTDTNPGFSGDATSVPLPCTLLLFGPGLAGLAAMRRWCKK
jgi:hypothetical protein